VRSDLLELYDSEMRREPALPAGLYATRVGGVVRLTGLYDCIAYSALSEANADAEIDREVAHFRRVNRTLEWKVHGHDRPADLADRLCKRGFRPDPTETLLVREIDGSLQNCPVNEDVVVRTVTVAADLDDFLAITAAAFGEEFSETRDNLMMHIKTDRLSLHVAYLKDRPIAAGRLDMPNARTFAGLYTGGVTPEFRGRGVYRALIRSRARLAHSRGYSFLIAEALESSREILEQLGFKRLTTVQGWILERQPD
jgi:GNAT superfamily N-acetyltransferase